MSNENLSIRRVAVPLDVLHGCGGLHADLFAQVAGSTVTVKMIDAVDSSKDPRILGCSIQA